MMTDNIKDVKSKALYKYETDATFHACVDNIVELTLFKPPGAHKILTDAFREQALETACVAVYLCALTVMTK